VAVEVDRVAVRPAPPPISPGILRMPLHPGR
jgi:hypothetical protein